MTKIDFGTKMPKKQSKVFFLTLLKIPKLDLIFFAENLWKGTISA